LRSGKFFPTPNLNGFRLNQMACTRQPNCIN
jgi:hypothetical protein